MTSRAGGSLGADVLSACLPVRAGIARTQTGVRPTCARTTSAAGRRHARAGAGRSSAPARACCRRHADGALRAFTLIELLVVILIIGLLASIITPVLFKARESARRRWAMKELTELGAAISMYHLDQSGYPPDTGDWGLEGGNAELELGQKKDEWSLHRYLGSTICDSRGEKFQSYFYMDSKRLTDVDADGIGKFTDPFGHPYQLDAMHMFPPDPDKPGSGWKACGWPYRLQTSGAPTSQEKQMMVSDFKFVSYGPDNLSVDYPFDPRPSDADINRAKDDIRPWE